MKTLLIALLIAAVSAEISFISFKTKACENLGLEYKNDIFKNGEATFLPNLGIMMVEMDTYSLFNTLLGKKSEFHECINEVSKNEIVTIEPLELSTSPNATREQWQLKRINVQKLPLPDTYHRFEVKDVPSHVYIIDSGMDKAHPDLTSRLAPEDEHKSFTSDFCACRDDGPLCDCNGHGTHCAGLVASPVAGYNPNTTLHAAKVFNSSGSASYATILSAMDWVIEAHKAHSGELAIVSMSLGGPKNAALNQAVTKVKDAGMFIIVYVYMC